MGARNSKSGAKAVTHPDGTAAVALPTGSSPDHHHVVLQVTPKLKTCDKLCRTEPLEKRLRDIAAFQGDDGSFGRKAQENASGLVDAGGAMPDEPTARVLADGHPHGFIAAAITAFANHYPFVLRPQHVHLMILQAIAGHVEQNAEAIRRKWVAHDGVKTLEVRRDDFVLGRANDWASVVTGSADSFAAQIAASLADDALAGELAPPLSGTTAAEAVAGAVTVMDLCKSYFAYKVMTLCGFPTITMEGTLEDWKALRASAAALLASRCDPTWAKSWGAALLPLLDKFVDEYCHAKLGDRPADERFWNSMVKRGGSAGSGSRTWFSGWVNILFPEIQRRPNRWAVPYSPSLGYVKEGLVNDKTYSAFADPPEASMPKGADGPDVADFPRGLAEAPVTWEYLGSSLRLSLKAGFVGAAQDPQTRAILPKVGWLVAMNEDERKG